MNSASLVAYATYRLDYTPPDQFAKTPKDEVLSGRQFRIEIPDHTDGGPLITVYDPDGETLNVNVSPSAIEGGPDEWYNYMVIDEHSEYAPPVKMSNAFGVEKDITFTKVRQIGVGAVRGHMGVFKIEDNALALSIGKNIPLSPDKARKIVKSLSLVIEGVVVPDREGRTINCEYHKEEPEIDRTYPKETSACIINVRVNRISVQTPARETLIEWRASHP